VTHPPMSVSIVARRDCSTEIIEIRHKNTNKISAQYRQNYYTTRTKKTPNENMLIDHYHTGVEVPEVRQWKSTSGRVFRPPEFSNCL